MKALKKIKYLIYLLPVILLFLFYTTSCEKKDMPVVTTASVSDVANTSAVCGGEVADEGSKEVIARGVVWSTSENPVIDNNDGYTIDSKGLGEFISTITGLTPNTRYYVRAYATSSEGTGYGRQKEFTTLCDDSLGEPCPDMPQFTDPRDGYTYNTVLIGDQCWMRENLAWLPEVHSGMTGSDSKPHYYVYDYLGGDVEEAKATENYKNYGVLYNWHAAQDACPPGWRLPNHADWWELADYLGGGSVAGGKLKSTRTHPDPHPKWQSPNKDATNESGFTAVPGGQRRSSMISMHFYMLVQWSFYWSYQQDSSPHIIYLRYDYSGMFYFYEDIPLCIGLSIRCIRKED